jgi:hypothetical protein
MLHSPPKDRISDALYTRNIIEEAYEQAVEQMGHSIASGSGKTPYWKQTVGHLMGELNWIEGILLGMETNN